MNPLFKKLFFCSFLLLVLLVVNLSFGQAKDTCNDSGGCILGSLCVSPGYHINKSFCSVEGRFISQKESTSSCIKNFECLSNKCVDNSCVNKNFLAQLSDWFKSFFGVTSELKQDHLIISLNDSVEEESIEENKIIEPNNSISNESQNQSTSQYADYLIEEDISRGGSRIIFLESSDSNSFLISGPDNQKGYLALYQEGSYQPREHKAEVWVYSTEDELDEALEEYLFGLRVPERPSSFPSIFFNLGYFDVVGGEEPSYSIWRNGNKLIKIDTIGAGSILRDRYLEKFPSESRLVIGCIDSDAGREYTVSGFTKYWLQGSGEAENWALIAAKDTCLNQYNQPNTLREGYCEGREYKLEDYACGQCIYSTDPYNYDRCV